MTDNYIVFNQDKTVGYLHCIREIDTKINNRLHMLHCHSNIYEIVMLLSGNVEFHVEGTVYKPNKNDIIIVRPNELHELITCGDEPYERYTLHITSDFFIKNNCQRFQSIFLNRRLGESNLIPSSMVENELVNLFMRIEKYFEMSEYFVANAAVIEFLFNLNSFKKETLTPKVKNERIKEILLYINENIKDNINLELLSEKFFIDKFYLCKAFKKRTSYTVNQYIAYKRVLYARELHDDGMTLTDACFNAGFNSYSNFYKAHIKFLGISPRNL